MIASQIKADCEKFNVRQTAADRWNLELLRQHLEDDGDDLHMVPVGQGYRDMSPGMRELERMIRACEIRHSNNPAMNWMMGNVNAKTDDAGNMKPVKPEHGRHEKIDAPVALMMAVSLQALHPVEPEFTSVYQQRGVLSL